MVHPFSRVIVALCCSAFILLATRALADTDSGLDALFGAHQPYKDFLVTLKSSAATKNWPAISEMIAYPITLSVAGRRISIRSPRAFLKHAPDIFTAKVLAAIERQNYATLFANSSGVMIGAGEIWFSGICKDIACAAAPVKITAINPAL
jgi:hypothetical protein